MDAHDVALPQKINQRDHSHSHSCQARYQKSKPFMFCQHCHAIMVKKNQDQKDELTVKGISGGNYVVPYSKDTDPNLVWEFMVKRQKVNRSHSNNVGLTKFRAEVVVWIQNCCILCKLSNECFHLSVGIFDAVIGHPDIQPKNYETIAHHAIYLAAIHEHHLECEEGPLTNTKALLGNRIGLEVFQKEQFYVGRIMNWSFNLKTPRLFLNFLFSSGIIFTDEVENLLSRETKDLITKVHQNANQILDKTLLNYELYKFSSLEVACATVYITRTIFNLRGWHLCLKELTQLECLDFQNCVFIINQDKSLLPISSSSLAPFEQDHFRSNVSHEAQKENSSLQGSETLNQELQIEQEISQPKVIPRNDPKILQSPHSTSSNFIRKQHRRSGKEDKPARSRKSNIMLRVKRKVSKKEASQKLNQKFKDFSPDEDSSSGQGK